MSPDPAVPERWINIAPGKICSQSSLSPYSRPDGARAGVNAPVARDFAIHTAHEARPWWQVDLGQPVPLQAVVVHNRRAPQWQHRSRRLRVECSLDGADWIVLHQGLSYFGTGPGGHPFRLELGGRVLARHLRLSLDEAAPLHLAGIEIYADAGDVALRDWLRLQGLRIAGLHVRASPDFYRPRYWLDGTGEIRALRVRRFGRFANTLLQIANAVSFARRTGIGRVILPAVAGLDTGAPIVAEGVTLLPEGTAPGDGGILVGDFFRLAPFDPGLAAEAAQLRPVFMRDHVRPRLDLLPVPGDLVSDARTVAIHIRSGDIFGPRPHRDYIQPPLAYYRLVLARLVARHGIGRVTLVAEDRANPCVDALAAHVRGLGLAFRFQSGGFRTDMQALLGARHLVFGYGTLGVGLALLSERIESLHYFSPGGAAQPYDDIPWIARLARISPGADYIPFGAWTASADQRRLMLDYPEDALSLRQLRDTDTIPT